MMTKVKRIVDTLYLRPAGKPSTQYRVVYRNGYTGDGGGGGMGIPPIILMLGGKTI